MFSNLKYNFRDKIAHDDLSLVVKINPLSAERVFLEFNLNFGVKIDIIPNTKLITYY